MIDDKTMGILEQSGFFGIIIQEGVTYGSGYTVYNRFVFSCKDKQVLEYVKKQFDKNDIKYNNNDESIRITRNAEIKKFVEMVSNKFISDVRNKEVGVILQCLDYKSQEMHKFPEYRKKFEYLQDKMKKVRE